MNNGFYGATRHVHARTEKKNLRQRSGFTLVEMVIATALLVVVFLVGFDLLWQVLSVQSKTLAVQEVQQNARIALRRIETEIRNSSGVTLASSTFGVDPGTLTLDYPGTGTDVVFDTATSTVTVGGVSMPYRMLRISVGGSPVALTNDRVDVTKFLLTNLTHGQTPATIRIDIGVQMLNPGSDTTRNASFGLSSTVSLRR
ncbi:MAG: prepilin-type N-terminal cleavage/methylation domain-containing protein [Patescibacteria group bacterium]|nr:prepilin-type N-terminal cleavage/methylation domain-containing protein [Patescibacteria group bacterium]